MFWPGLSKDTKFSNANNNIFSCCDFLLGAPSSAPIGTIGDMLLGAPHLIEISGNADIIIVGITDFSNTLCTTTINLWHVTQPPVKMAPPTLSSFNILAILSPVSFFILTKSPPPP